VVLSLGVHPKECVKDRYPPVEIAKLTNTSGHVTTMAVTPFDPCTRKTHATRKPDGSIFYRTRVMGVVYIAGMGISDVFDSYDLDLDLMTFMYELDKYVADVQIGTLIRQGFRKLSPDRLTCRHTELIEIINHAASRVAKNDQAAVILLFSTSLNCLNF